MIENAYSKVQIGECGWRFFFFLLFLSSGSVALYYISKRRWKIKSQDLIILTGSNSGLGYSLAMHCRAQGATVLAGVRESPMVLKSNAAVKSLRDEGILVYHLDITNEESVRKFGERVKELLEEQQLGEQYTEYLLLNIYKKFQGVIFWI